MTEPPNNPNEGGWVSLTELAAIKGVGKAAMSERVSGLEAKGLVATRRGKGNAKLINLAEFDRATAGATDLAKLAAAATKRLTHSPATDTAANYTQAQALKMGYDADLARMKRDERSGQLVETARVRDAAAMIAEALARSLDQLPSQADDLAGIVAKEGAQGLRAALKDKARAIRADIAEKLAALAQTATLAAEGATEPIIEEP